MTGRSGSETRRRRSAFSIRLSPDELDRLQGEADAVGVSLGKLIRDRALTPDVVEYAVQMSGGGMHVRYTDPDIERVYPLADWLAHRRREGNVYRRRIRVVTDWEDLAGGVDQDPHHDDPRQDRADQPTPPPTPPRQQGAEPEQQHSHR